MKFIVIGITDHPQPFFPPDVLEMIGRGKVFSGGKRHHEIVASLLPQNAVWIDITVPIEAVFEKYKPHDEVVVFASGDPLFFGFANTIKRKLPDADIILYPTFNSLQTLAHRLVLPYHDLRIVSLTGRPWQELDRALIERAAKIGVLTDKEHTPSTIAQRMIDYGYTSYQMHVGEHLGNPTKEKISTFTLTDATQYTATQPNCLILESPQAPSQPSSGGRSPVRMASSPHGGIRKGLFGIPDGEFALLNGREKMITKMPIRLLTLQALDLPNRHTLWDIGFCTGSVSIEARLLFPHLRIEAFEIRPEGQALMEENSRRFGAPGIHTHIGDFLTLTAPPPPEEAAPPLSAEAAPPFPVGCDSVAALPTPDTAFIGGHGGQLKAIMARLAALMPSHGRIVFNSVTPQSLQLWKEACQELGLIQLPPLHIQLNDFNPINIRSCELP